MSKLTTTRKRGDNMAETTVAVKVNGIDEACDKAEKLCNLLKEARSLANELARLKCEIDLEFNV